MIFANTQTANSTWDVVIVGTGPSGLALACALASLSAPSADKAQRPLKIALLDSATEESLQNPAFDGREIALTHFSYNYLENLGALQHIPPEAISALKDAWILNGPSLSGLKIMHTHGKKDQLGYLVSNHLIRKSLYLRAKELQCATFMSETKVSNITLAPNDDNALSTVHLTNRQTLNAQLIVGADSRFSVVRRAAGISARMHDFGREMLVCVMQHEKPHHHVAWEWFDNNQTLALLPMNQQCSSVVLTLAQHEMQKMMALDETSFSQAMTERFARRLGTMQLCSTRHVYPLVSAYASRFVTTHLALIGDAAVGMHPVTAHGFNFGLRSVHSLTHCIQNALNHNQPIGSERTLIPYQTEHRKHTLPLFMATHALTKLYTKESNWAQPVRSGLLRVSERLLPFKRMVASALVGQ